MTQDFIPLGLNVYFWGRSSKNRLVMDCLAPAAHQLRQEEKTNLFWYDRFDARSPHVFAIFGVSGTAALEEVRIWLSMRLDRYLMQHPSTEALSQEEIDTRHDACQGKTMCEADHYPGPAPNNSYHLFRHDEKSYPFWLTAGLSGSDELWELVEDLTFWSIKQLSARPTLVAVQWLARLDQELNRAQLEPANYWHYHAGTLMLNLDKILESEGQDFLDSMPKLVGQKNTETFSRIWQEMESTPRQEPWPHFPRLLDIIFNDPDWPVSRRHCLLREVIHWALKQLGVYVGLFHIPLIFFAWSRNLSLSEKPQG